MKPLRSWLPLALLSSLAAGCATPAAPIRFEAVTRATDGGCIVRFDGREVADAELLAIARARARRTHEAQVATTGADTPWRCVAGLIYRLQMAGFEKINFAALPSPRR